MELCELIFRTHLVRMEEPWLGEEALSFQRLCEERGILERVVDSKSQSENSSWFGKDDAEAAQNIELQVRLSPHFRWKL